jgi:hypothetical protein
MIRYILSRGPAYFCIVFDDKNLAENRAIEELEHTPATELFRVKSGLDREWKRYDIRKNVWAIVTPESIPPGAMTLADLWLGAS